jgi:hypothetical protein
MLPIKTSAAKAGRSSAVISLIDILGNVIQAKVPFEP